MVETRTIAARCPTCNWRVNLRAVTVLPRQTYTRHCRGCNTTYQIERTTSVQDWGIIDKLTWVDTATRLYTDRYGT